MFYRRGLMSIDISFDGVGNDERVFHNGKKSSNAMIKIFRNMMKHRVKYRIRYTIQKSNINNLYDDITKIIASFKPERLITSVAWDTLDDLDIIYLNDVKEKFRGSWLSGDIKTPICELFCDVCNGCGERKELKTYFTDEGNVTTYDNYYSAPKFHDFKDKEII